MIASSLLVAPAARASSVSTSAWVMKSFVASPGGIGIGAAASRFLPSRDSNPNARRSASRRRFFPHQPNTVRESPESLLSFSLSGQTYFHHGIAPVVSRYQHRLSNSEHLVSPDLTA